MSAIQKRASSNIGRAWLTAFPRVVLLNYREDGVTPYVVVWKHGVKEVKV